MSLRSRYALGLLAAIFLVLLLLQTPLLALARGRVWSLWTVTVGRWFAVGPMTVPGNVEEQLTKLRAENVRLKTEAIDLRRLREQLGSVSYDDFGVIPAEVMARPLDPFRARYIINRGASDGVTLDAPAVVAGSILVGFVSELAEHTAVLQLLLHPATSLPAEVLTDEAPSKGLLSGKTFTAVVLTNVSRDAPLMTGQDVVTASQPGIVPPGLLIGQVMTVKDEDNEPFQQARVQVAFDPDRLYAVSLLVP